MSDDCFGYNEFYYTLKSGEDDPYAKAPLGDLNEDGEVTSLDSVILARSIASWVGYEGAAAVESADLNGDGGVTSLDSVILARHIAGWTGYDSLPIIT